MGEALEFEVLNKDSVIASVKYDYTEGRLCVNNYGVHFLDANILRGVNDLEDLNAWFESRCFLRSRADSDFLLKSLGLSTYAPYNIVRKTNGALFEDTYWIRFSDQPGLAWKDIDPRNDL